MQIKSQFVAIINNEEVDNQAIYTTVSWLNDVYCEMTNDKNGLPDYLLKRIYDVIHWWWYKYEYANLQELESNTYSLSEDCECLQLACEYYNGVFDEVNQSIKEYVRSVI